jgi:hypothetical protein
LGVFPMGHPLFGESKENMWFIFVCGSLSTSKLVIWQEVTDGDDLPSG